MLKRLVMAALACVLLGACSKQEGREEVEAEEISLSVGLYETGELFMEWEGALYYNVMTNGSFEYIDEISCEGTFGHAFGQKDIKLKLAASFESDDVYVISGSYTAKEPFTLTYLGSAEEDADHVVQSFAAGEGEIQFRGEAPYSYKKE